MYHPNQLSTKDGKGPNRQILEQTLRLPIIHRPNLAALGSHRSTVVPGDKINDQSVLVTNEFDEDGAVNNEEYLVGGGRIERVQKTVVFWTL